MRLKKQNLNDWWNLQYYVDVDYSTTRDCANNRCNEDGNLCRCSKITDEEIVEPPDLYSLAHYIAAKFTYKKYIDDVFLYSINRILRTMNITTESYSITVSRGYYGEEIDGVTLDCQHKIVKEINKIMKMTNLCEKLKHLLFLEYGYVLDKLGKYKKAELVSISPKKIIVPSKEHYRNLNKKAVDYYRDWDLPIGIVDHHMLLIDGYHRFHANENKEAVKVFRFIDPGPEIIYEE